MAKPEEKIFKKGYTEFDQRLDQELEEEREARRKKLLLQAPDYKLLNWMAENSTETTEMSVRLKDACYYFLRSGAEDETEKFMAVWHKMLQGQPSLREDILKQAGFLGCLAFKKNMPVLGRSCAEIILEDLRLLGNDIPELTGEGYLLFKNVTDTAAHTHSDAEFNKIVAAFSRFWTQGCVAVTPGLLSVLTDLLFVASDRRQTDALGTVCRLSRSVLRHKSVDAVMQQHFVLEWSGIAAQIAQRGWDAECIILLRNLCLFLGSARDASLLKKVMADISVHMQMQAKWDGLGNAFHRYYPCQMFVLAVLYWALRKYNNAVNREADTKSAALRNISLMEQIENRMNLVSEKEYLLDIIRFLLRNVRDTVAACARLLMKDEWEIYVEWQRLWLSHCGRSKKRQQQVRRFMQMAAEYWHSTQPSRSKKQWEKMVDVMWSPQLSMEDLDLLKLLA